MLQQHYLKNLRRKVSIPALGFRFCISKYIWEQTVFAIGRYRPHKSEGLVFWGGGIGAAGEVYVSTLYLPNHSPQGGHARPDQQAMRQLVRSLYVADQKLLAQVHSHPSEAFHSFGDDENAASYLPGYISIVMPNFGCQITSIQQCAVYEFDGQRFTRLSNNEVSTRFMLESQVVELAPWDRIIKETLWKKLSKKLKFIGRKKQ